MARQIPVFVQPRHCPSASNPVLADARSAAWSLALPDAPSSAVYEILYSITLLPLGTVPHGFFYPKRKTSRTNLVGAGHRALHSARASPSLRITAAVGAFIPIFCIADVYGITANILAGPPDMPWA